MHLLYIAEKDSLTLTVAVGIVASIIAFLLVKDNIPFRKKK
jgi:hypothetical protein